jgi:hypothetical protein
MQLQTKCFPEPVKLISAARCPTYGIECPETSNLTRQLALSTPSRSLQPRLPASKRWSFVACVLALGYGGHAACPEVL